MPRFTRKTSRKVDKSAEKLVSSKSPPSKCSVHAARLKVIPLQLSACPTGLPSGSKASSVPGRKKATKSALTSMEEGPHGAGDQPEQLLDTEEEVHDPATPKPPLALKQNQRKKAWKGTCAHRSCGAIASGAHIDSPAPGGRNEKASAQSRTPLALGSQSGPGEVRRLTFEVSQGRSLPTTFHSEVAPTGGALTPVARSRSAKEQSVKSAIHEEPQQDEPKSSHVAKQRRLSDDTPTESAMSRRKAKAAGDEASESALRTGKGEKAAAQKQRSVATTEVAETLETVSLQPGISRKTTKQNVVTVSSKLLPTASVVRMARPLSKSLEEQRSKNAIPKHVKQHAKKGDHASAQQHLSHSLPADVTRRLTRAAVLEVTKADLQGSGHRRPSAQERCPTPSTWSGRAEKTSSLHFPIKNVSSDKHHPLVLSSGQATYSSEAPSGHAKSTTRAHLRSMKEYSMSNAVSEQFKQHAHTVADTSKQQHTPSGGTQTDSHRLREQDKVADMESQNFVVESNEHRRMTTGSSPTPTNRRGAAETSKRMSNGKRVTVHTTGGPTAKAPSMSRNKQSTSIVDEAERSGHASKQQRCSSSDSADDIPLARRRVTVPVDFEGMSPLHPAVFELSRFTKSSAAPSSPQLAQRETVSADAEGMSPLRVPVLELSRLTKTTAKLSLSQSAASAVVMEHSSSPYPLVLESTRISQTHARPSPRDQAEKGKRSSKSSHRQKRQWPAPWGDLLVLDSTHEGEKEPAHRNISPVLPSPVASDAAVAKGESEVNDSVMPWYEKFFGKCGTEEHHAPLAKGSDEDDDVESVHWKVDYHESSCHSTDSSLELLSVDSNNEVVDAFEKDCRFRKLSKQPDQSKQSHREAQRLERQQKDTRRRVQQFLSGITLTQGAFEAFEQCEEIMMEHVQQSVQALAKHAGRKRVEDLDVITFIQRYLGTSDPAKLMAQAEELLPAEQCRCLFPPTPNVLSVKAKRPSQK